MTRSSPLPRMSLAVMLAGLLAGLLGTMAMGPSAALAQSVAPITLTEVRGVITPVIADHLRDVVGVAEGNGSQALVVVLDTPGGLVSSMRDIVQTFFEADVPVVVYVSPRGADAGSAGTFITMAAHVAAMAPATTIGAATPVDIQGGEISDKITNNAAAYAQAIAEERGRNVEFALDAVRDGRSITVTEAVSLGVVDFEADDLEDLYAKLDGREITLASKSIVTLATTNALIEQANLSGTRSILQRLADPNLAFIFLSIATLAIIYEIASPGLGAGGVVGITLIILAMFSLSVLPVNYAGAALIVMAAVLFILELFIPGVGVAATGGTISLLLGGLFLFQRPTGIGIDLGVLLPTVVVLAAMTMLAGRLARRSLRRKPVDNHNGLIGRQAVAQIIGGNLRVKVDGTSWSTSETDISLAGRKVVITNIEGLTLDIAPAPAEAEFNKD